MCDYRGWTLAQNRKDPQVICPSNASRAAKHDGSLPGQVVTLSALRLALCSRTESTPPPRLSSYKQSCRRKEGKAAFPTSHQVESIVCGTEEARKH